MMKLHHFLKFLIITTFVILSKANEDADYDVGFEEPENLPEPQPQVVRQDEPKQSAPFESNLFKSLAFPDASFYIPVAIAAGVLLNIIVISTLVVMKRRRVSSYRRMQLNRATPVFRELQMDI